MVQAVLPEGRVWRLYAENDDPISPNTITVAVGTIATFGMDFSPLLGPEEELNGSPTVAVDTGTAFTTIGTPAVSGSGNRVLVDITVGSTAGERKVKVTTTTTESNTLVRFGYLAVE